MCGPKEPIAGVILLLVLAAGGWVVQEPFPHFGIDLTLDTPVNRENSSRHVSPRHSPLLDDSQFSSAMLEPVHMYAVIEQPNPL
ncbi:Uncharacterized protein ABJ99_1060 [Pseudomonas syringae pv. cilantro]|uniref:Uncharacterized protein n=2 Tax=Pseudomonas syringae group TaxID=136849 RepID=A0A0N1JQ35_PSESX|nr:MULTISPECIES: hypothetical protein [Pseudomonas syringae group]KPC36387.1 Uncharacterized protein ABJ99_1060 [Pseudomonas syringae pv. cilantro]KPW75043.1 Uncharacterized protein ALO76_03588 [Pseudomonas syringae pv. coriandricola]RMN09893.1 hypothetical protein ALQ65_00261 [Pseudomonas syringae pv. coriandricola]